MNLLLCLYNKSSRSSTEQNIKLHLIVSSLTNPLLEVLVSDYATWVILSLIEILFQLLIKDINLFLCLTLFLSNNFLHFILESDVAFHLCLVLIIHLLLIQLIVVGVTILRIFLVGHLIFCRKAELRVGVLVLPLLLELPL